MNKSELVDSIAKSADISKAAAERALNGAIKAIRQSLKKGHKVGVVGFGTFFIGKRSARNGRNPRTGQAIRIKSMKLPRFRPGKALRDAIK